MCVCSHTSFVRSGNALLVVVVVVVVQFSLYLDWHSIVCTSSLLLLLLVTSVKLFNKSPAGGGSVER